MTTQDRHRRHHAVPSPTQSRDRTGACGFHWRCGSASSGCSPPSGGWRSTRGWPTRTSQGRPRPVEFLTGFDHWQLIPQIGAAIMVVVLTVVVVRGWRRNPGSPVLLMVIVHDADRLAGPDHELVAIRGVQPDVVALAGILVPGR